MTGLIRPRIVVGVAGEHCDAALDAAAEQARLRGMGVHLVHVVRPLDVRRLETADIARWADDTERSGRLMAGLVQRLTSLLDDELPVTTAVWHGEVVPSLAAASSDAALVVVQHQRIARRAHGSLRSVTQGVMAQTSAPVLVVPDGWRPRAGVGSRMITVGMPASSAATGILRAALEEAERLDGRLLVVHAVRHDPSTEPEADDPAGDAWFRHQRLQQAVSRLAGERPEVPVEVAVVADSPAEALVRAAATSALVVVGRRHSRIGAGTHAGHVVHELLTRCPCPVLVVDPLKGSGRAMSVA